MTKLFRVGSDGLVAARPTRLATESQLEDWIFADASIIGLDVLIVGRQVITDHGGRIDLLAIERSGNLAVIELKRDRTPREVIAQALDYASWVAKLTTVEVHRIARQHLAEKFETAFRTRFDESLPESLNETHSIVIVASEFDASSRRIVEYLAEQGGIAINTAFFAAFEDAGHTYVATDWLLDQEAVIERSVDRSRAPWSGLWYANIDDGRSRAWEDMRRYGFVAAGGGRGFSG